MTGQEKKNQKRIAHRDENTIPGFTKAERAKPSILPIRVIKHPGLNRIRVAIVPAIPTESIATRAA
jgi:hypothetical protein